MIDHKTTSKYPGELPTKEDVVVTPQMVGYAKVFFETHDARSVKVSHNYIGTKKRFAERVTGEVTRKDTDARWAELTKDVTQVKLVARAKCADDVPKNKESCFLFHRECMHLEECFPDPLVQLTLRSKPMLQRFKKTAPESKPEPKEEITQVTAIIPPDAPESDPQLAAEPPPEPVPEPKAKRAKSAKQESALLVIGVGCVAPGVQSLQPYVDSLVAELNKVAETVDVRTIRDKDSPMAYGGWKGALAYRARTNPPAPGVYAVAGSEFVDAVIEGLGALAVVFDGR